MYKTRGELKADARSQLKGNWLQTIIITLIVFAVATVASMIDKWGWLVSVFVMSALTFGYVQFFMKLRTGEQQPIANTFSGFHPDVYFKAVGTYVLMLVFITLWTLLLIIPGIIAAIRYSQSFYILNDNPDLSPLEVINRSKEMMKGHIWEYFVLCMSFFGWYILCGITLGIAIIWVFPYLQATFANFYANLKAQRDRKARIH